MVRFETVKEYNEYYNQTTQHPLVSVVDLSQSGLRQRTKMYFGLYLIVLKKVSDAASRIRYGVNYYDYEDGTLVFFAPGQILHSEPDGEWFQPISRVIAFHPDLIKGTALGRTILSYSFFSYQSNEALHVSEKEKEIVKACFDNIYTELQQRIDRHSRQLIVSNIELLLNYCTRFYDRQFITRETTNTGILEKFELLLNDYIVSDQAMQNGLPSVAYFASALNLSANYFGDTVKKSTGKSAQEYIHMKIIDVAKVRTLDTEKSLAEISYELGFKYPQHFTRLFKQKTGYTPQEYRVFIGSTSLIKSS